VIHRAAPTIVLIFLAMLTSAAPDEEKIGHLIRPGYTPEQQDDEKGLWLEFEEIELQLKKSALLVEDVYLNDYVRKIVCRVAGPYCGDFRVYVMRNPGFNASMTATGMLQIWTGLITRASSSDEFAAVVGHEIAHYTRLHSLEKLRDMKKKSATGAFFDVILIATTGYGGVGQAAALMSILSFSREQETEADILGSRLLAQAQYDPHASYRVWQNVIDEEEAAVVKHDEPTAFSRTHPEAKIRMQYLKSWVTTRYGEPDVEIVADQPFIDMLNANYMFLMEDQIDTNRFGRTKEILERHAEIGVEPSFVRFFYGEMFRQRGGPGDDDQAMAAYRHSIEGGEPPPQTYKNLGYLHLKKGEIKKAQVNFRLYLEFDPDASDRAMIEFYLEES
jgi:hypothetical protein